MGAGKYGRQKRIISLMRADSYRLTESGSRQPLGSGDETEHTRAADDSISWAWRQGSRRGSHRMKESYFVTVGSHLTCIPQDMVRRSEEQSRKAGDDLR